MKGSNDSQSTGTPRSVFQDGSGRLPMLVADRRQRAAFRAEGVPRPRRASPPLRGVSARSRRAGGRVARDLREEAARDSLRRSC